MSGVYFDLTAFTSGQVGPRIYARKDLEKYQSALSQLSNMKIWPQGGVEKRSGLLYVKPQADESQLAILKRFKFNKAQQYMLEIGNGYARIFNSDHSSLDKLYTDSDVTEWVTATAYVAGDFVYVGTTVYRCILGHTSGSTSEPSAGVNRATYWLEDAQVYLVLPYGYADLRELTFRQSGDTVFIQHGSYPPRKLVRTGATTWETALVDFTWGPFEDENTEDEYTVKLDAFDWAATTAYVVGDVVQSSSNYYRCKTAHTSGASFANTNWTQIYWFEEGDQLKLSFLKDGAATDEILYGTDFAGSQFYIHHLLPAYTFKENLTTDGDTTAIFLGVGEMTVMITDASGSVDWSGSVSLQRSDDGGVTWYEFQYHHDNMGKTAVYNYSLGKTVSLYKAVFDKDNYEVNISARVVDFEAEAYVIVDSVDASLEWATVTLGEESFYFPGDETYLWARAAWNEIYGYPYCSEFFQERLWFGGCPNDPLKKWASRSSDFYDFKGGSLDSDGLDFSIGSSTQERITSLTSQMRLMVNTTGDEYTITATGGAAITPTAPPTIGNPSSNGAAPIEAVKAGTTLVYVNQNLKKLMAMSYDMYSETFQSNDLNLYAHDVLDEEVQDLAIQQDPEMMLWCPLGDGTMAGLTLMLQQEVIGWHGHSTPGGEIESVATIDEDVWVTVKRTINSVTRRYIEVWSEWDRTIENAMFLDCAYVYDGVSTATITGLGHLEGETVGVFAGGRIQTDKVVASGQITLDAAATHAVIEKRYKAAMRTLDLDLLHRQGSAAGHTKTIKTVGILFLDSYGCSLGRSATDTLETIDFDEPGTGESITLYTGWKVGNYPGGHDRGAYVYLENDDPVPFCVAAMNIFAEATGL